MKCLSKPLLLGTLILVLFSIPAPSTSISYAVQACVQPPDGLVSWWPGNGDATDIAGGNDGALEGNATFAPGLVGQAFSLNGGYDHISVGNPTNLNLFTSGITLGAWVNPSEAPAEDDGLLTNMFAIVTKWGQSRTTDAYALWLRKPDGNVRPVGGIGVVGNSDHGQLYAGVVPVGQWTHVAMTYDVVTGLNKLYVNGEFVAERSRPGGIAQSNLNVLIGREDSYLSRSFKGRIDEVEIYDRPLSADEIEAVYNAGSAGKCKTITVAIDIKPGSDPNCFNNNGRGVIPVAILGSAEFDVSRIDPATVQLQGLEVKRVGKGDKPLAHIKDVNHDGFDDLVVQIQDREGTFTSGSGTAKLTGNLWDEIPFEGSDSICIVP